MSENLHQPLPDHRVKVAHLVFGLIFLGVAAIWSLVATEVITGDRLTITVPVLIIGAGVIGLVATLASSRNRRHLQSDLTHDRQDSYAPVQDELGDDEDTREIR